MAYQGVNALTPFWEFDKNKSALPRGLRGYRKYKNGLLNVTPIEGEIELVEQNARDSPLLSLPPEMRALIWEFTIGGNIIRPSLKKAELDKTTDYIRPPKRRFSLLRVSRQVYFEAAILVWKLSTFRFYDSIDLQGWSFSATAKAHDMIHMVELGGEMRSHGEVLNDLIIRRIEVDTLHSLKKLPNVTLFEIRLCGRYSEPNNIPSVEEELSRACQNIKEKKNVKFTVRVLPSKKCWGSIYKKGTKDYL